MNSVKARGSSTPTPRSLEHRLGNEELPYPKLVVLLGFIHSCEGRRVASVNPIWTRQRLGPGEGESTPQRIRETRRRKFKPLYDKEGQEIFRRDIPFSAGVPP